MKDKWTNYFVRAAFSAATNSTCLRHNFGAVLVQDRTIVSTGYNGSPRGAPNCRDLGHCLKDSKKLASGNYGFGDQCHAVHAEQNAVIHAGRQLSKGGTLYTTGEPCFFCAKTIVNAGIKNVVFVLPYPDENRNILFQKTGVRIRQFIPESLVFTLHARNQDEIDILARIGGVEVIVA